MSYEEEDTSIARFSSLRYIEIHIEYATVSKETYIQGKEFYYFEKHAAASRAFYHLDI
jgi:hypothetical protein